MAIYDCFQYFNEDHMLDLRFSILNDHVDHFVISESTKTHQGERKKLNFNINNFLKYKDKIKYIVADFDKDKGFIQHVGGESIIEQHQRNSISKGLEKANDNDLIILSDSDELPDMSKLSQIRKGTKFTAFSQKMFMYKLNLQNLNENNWIGSKVCLKKNLPVLQKLRDMKFKKYSFWRIDKRNIQIIEGGWHFSFLGDADFISAKIKSYVHSEYDKDDYTNLEKINYRIKNQIDPFDRNKKLVKTLIDSSYPDYILHNQDKYKDLIL